MERTIIYMPQGLESRGLKPTQAGNQLSDMKTRYCLKFIEILITDSEKPKTYNNTQNGKSN